MVKPKTCGGREGRKATADFAKRFSPGQPCSTAVGSAAASLLARQAAAAAGCVDGGRGLRVPLLRRRPARRGADRRLPPEGWSAGEGMERQRCVAVAGAAIELQLEDAAELLHHGLRRCAVKRASETRVLRRECPVRRQSHKEPRAFFNLIFSLLTPKQTTSMDKHTKTHTI